MKRCPIKNSFWRELTDKIGENLSWRLYAEFGESYDKAPSIDDFLSNLSKTELGKVVLNEDMSKINSVISNQIKSLENQIIILAKSSNSTNETYNQNEINRIKKTIADTIKRKEGLELSKAVNRLIEGAKEDLEQMFDYVSNKANRKNSNFISRLLNYKTFIEDHNKIAIPELGYGKKVIITNINEVSNLINNLKKEIYNELENEVESNVKDRTTNKKLIDNPEELKSILKETTDINIWDLNLLDIFTTPDALIANFGKIFREKQQILFKRNDSFTKKLTAAGNKLARLNNNKIDHSFMIDGGNYVKRDNKALRDKNVEITNKGKNKDGVPLEFYKISDPTTADPKQIQHNIELAKVKQEIREWKSTEVFDEEGNPSDGENYRYTEEFKNERANFEEPSFNGRLWEWVKKESVSDEAYAKYKSIYYGDPVALWIAARDSDGNPTGGVYLREVSFVKGDFVEVTDKWVSEKFKALQEDNSAYGKAKREFYDVFVDIMENGALQKIGTAQRRRMIGRLPVVRSSTLDQYTNNGEGFFKVFSRSIRNYFKPDSYTSARVLDENGFSGQDIPIFYVSNLKDQAKIDKLIEERKNLSAADLDFKSKFDALSNQIAQETKRLDEGELETDLVKSLTKFMAMAENFEVKKELESTALAFKTVIESRNYLKGNGEKVVGVSSNVAKRFNNFMNFQLYQSNEQDNSLVATVAKKLQVITSLQGVAFAPLGWVNNYALGRIQQKIEALSNQYVTNKSYNDAGVEYRNEYLPNIVKELTPVGEGPYKSHKSYSKYSAFVKNFNFMSNHFESGGLNSLAFSGTQGGEFANISRLGIAFIKDYKVKDSSGKDISLYDAYNFDVNTGEIELKKGIKFPDREKFDLVNKIQQVASIIHGKYTEEEKNVLQNHWLGQLGFQYHKWIVPAYKARFAGRGQYANEATGVENEGRWLSTWNFLVRSKEFSGNFKLAYAQADEIEKVNLVKTAYELAFFVSSYAAYGIFKHIKDELPEDDENLRVFVGFFESQSKKQAGELSSFLNPYEYVRLGKNPLPIIKTVESGLELMANGLALPYQMASDSPGAYYSSGKNKGSLKFLVNATNFTPGFRQITRLNDLAEEQDFFK